MKIFQYFNSLRRNVNNCLETPAQQGVSSNFDNRNMEYRLINTFNNGTVDPQCSDDGHSNSDCGHSNSDYGINDDSDLSFEFNDSDSIGSAISNASEQLEKIEVGRNLKPPNI